MIPIDQTVYSNQYVTGNYFAACLASLIEVELNDVPPFDKLGGAWHGAFDATLKYYGYRFKGTHRFVQEKDGYGTPLSTTWHGLKSISNGVDGYFICAGPSVRRNGLGGHAVIYKDGRVAHDPHFSREGLKELHDAYMIERM